MKRSSLAATAAIVLAFTGWAIPAAAAASTTDEPAPSLKVVDGEFQVLSPTGELLRAVEETGDEAERGLSGTYGDGVPWSAWLLSALPPITPRTEAETQALERQMSLEPVLTESQQVEEGYLPEDLELDVAQLEPKLGYLVTPSSVSFAWPAGAVAAVYRDGAYIGEAVDGVFVDVKVEAGGVYEYSFELGGDGDAADSVEHSQRVTIAVSPESALDVVVSPMAYQAYTTAYVHKTFIADAFATLDWYQTFNCAVDANPFNSVSFSGDNRSFLNPAFNTPYDTPNYRTEMFFNVNWDNPAPYQVVTVKDTGQTKYYLNGVYQSTRVAPTTSMTFAVSGSSTYVQVDHDHFAANPNCLLGAIDYSETVDLYRSTGFVSVVGSGRPVPSHEAYFRYDTSSGYGVLWTYHILLNNAGFGCLLGGCTPANFNGSQTLPSV